ncbi:MAG: hypothetical protein M1824_000539 [Vezdaea acicularis]|nr:MAG: hypothetical protein M1824_000539 [Vezdaea acicularis]
MAFFTRFPANDFAPFFQLLEEVDKPRHHKARCVPRTFQPRFDVREVENTYELQGELPGIEQSNLSIEFSDEHTLVVKGHSERGSSKAAGKASEKAAESNDEFESITVEDATPTEKSHQPTVEDEAAASEAESSTVAAATPATESPREPTKPKVKYWVSERSVGQFSRSFRFPERVDQEAVKASLKNGILNVIVPKAAIPAPKTIQIE